MIKGVVQKILVNPQYGLTSFTLKGQDGFYSLGKDKPTFKEGDSIQFETNQVGKYTYAKDIAPWLDGGTTSGAPVSSVASSGGNQWKGRGGFQRGGGAGAAAKDEYWAAKEARDIAKEGIYELTQKRIEIQAARNAAIETAKAMWQFEIVPKPKKATEHYDTFLALVDELTTQYMGNTATRLDADIAPSVVDTTSTPPQEAAGPQPASDGKWD